MNDEIIYNVGITDGNIKYNSYLVMSDKIVLIDTVKEEFSSAFVDNITKVIDVEKIDYLILNHTEYDRAGCVCEILKLNPYIKVISTILGLKNLKEQLNVEFNEMVAKSGMKLEIGNNKLLKFIITHNINWPDSMMTLYENEGILFSCDGFSDEGDGIDGYYRKKLSHLKIYVNSAVENLKEFEIKKILPGSGNEIADIKKTYSVYEKLGMPKCTDKKTVVLIYESVSGNNKKLADYACKYYSSIDNIEFKMIDAKTSEKDKILELIDNSDGVIFASPTIDRNITENISRVINSLNHYKMTNKIFFAFGSYGWSGEGPNLIYSLLRARHFETVKSPYRVLFSPTVDDYAEFENKLKEFNERLMRE